MPNFLPTLWVALCPKEKAVNLKLFEPKEGWELSETGQVVTYDEVYLFDLFKLTNTHSDENVRALNIKILEYATELFLMSNDLGSSVMSVWCDHSYISPVAPDSTARRVAMDHREYSEIKLLIRLMKENDLADKQKTI